MINKIALFSTLKSKNLLIKLLLSYLGTAIISVLLITSLNTYWVKKEGIKDINSITELALSNISTLASNMFESSKNTAFDIFNNSYVKSLLSSEEIDKLDIVGAAGYIDKLTVSNPSIFSVYVCSGKSLVFGTCREIGYEESYEAISKLVKNGRVLYPITRRIKNDKGNLINVYTIIYHEEGLGENDIDSVVILDIDARVLYNQIYTKFLKPDQDIFVADTGGNILLHNDTERFSTSILKEAYYKNAMDLHGNAGAFDIKENGQDMVYNYVFDKNGKFIVFSKSKYSMLFNKVTKIRNTILLTCTLVLLFIFLISIMLSRWLYTPINNVFSNIRSMFRNSVVNDNEMAGVNEYKFISQAVGSLVQRLNTLEKDSENSSHIMRNAFIKSLLTESGELDTDSIQDGMVKYKILDSVNDSFCLMVIRLDNYNDFILHNKKEAIDFQLSSIVNMASEALKPILRNTFCEMDSEHIALILSTDSQKNHYELESQIVEAMKYVQDAILQLFNIGVTTGISEFTSNICEMRTKYKQAFSFTNYRLIYGKCSIFTSKSVKFKEAESDKINYYTGAVLNSIRNNSRNEYCGYIHKLFEQVKNCSYEKIVKVFFQLANSILHIPVESQSSYSDSLEYDIQDVYDRIKRFESYEDLEDWFKELYVQTETIMANIKNKKNPDLIEHVLKYINENYHESNISANLMADKLSITPQYFSKIFNEYVGVSFPDYVNNVRMEKARELLLTNDKLNVSNIYEMVGYNNRSYFTSTFTKKYGISPGRFKSESARKKIIE